VTDWRTKDVGLRGAGVSEDVNKSVLIESMI
jgi:hypothetical protein